MQALCSFLLLTIAVSSWSCSRDQSNLSQINCRTFGSSTSFDCTVLCSTPALLLVHGTSKDLGQGSWRLFVLADQVGTVCDYAILLNLCQVSKGSSAL